MICVPSGLVSIRIGRVRDFQGAISLSVAIKPDKSQESSNATGPDLAVLAPNRGMGYQDRP
jgi:hypothetical protein